MQKGFRVILLIFIPVIGYSQLIKPDSLRNVLNLATTDRERYNACVEIYFYYLEANRDSAFYYTEKRLALAKKNKIALAEAAALISKAYQYNAIGKYSEAFSHLTRALVIAEDPKTDEVEGWKVTQYPIPGKNKQVVLSTIHHVLGGVMRNTANYEQEIIQLKQALRIAKQINHPDRQMTGNMNLGSAYLRMGQPDSALYYAKAAQVLSGNPLAQGYIGNNLLTIGNIYLAKGQVDTAKRNYYEGLMSARKQNNQADVANLNHSLFSIYLEEGNKDSALSYALANLQIIKSVIGVGYREFNIGVANEDLSLAFQLAGQKDSTIKYQRLALATKDSLHKLQIGSIADFQKLSLAEAMRLEKLEKERLQTQSRVRTYGFLSGLVVLSIIGFILYRSNRQKQKANDVLAKTLSELKSTQAQLVQSEKMASLGELTAGIAHEIQNPLNFVNNFSEVNKELISELVDEVDKGNTEDVKLIAADIRENSERIHHHGKRADAIVKGMLQHSRSSSGQKEPTDINALCDEYLRLAFHGLKAKDNTFNAGFKTELDPNLGLINVVPQDFGRVLLNLINNAFYAVAEKSKTAGPSYEPAVTVSTKRKDNIVEIAVADNGNGIPDAIKEKIFQPFFTTKPTGEGTGLGLSLSYDIIKTHGGELKLETKAGKETTFMIELPLT